MNIIEATKRCILNNKVMYRECFDQILYEPTNTDECIIVRFENKKAVRWNPTADDIVANDWNVAMKK